MSCTRQTTWTCTLSLHDALPICSGDQVAIIEDLRKRYGPRVIYDGLNLTVRRGERWAVMGKNGAGKTTLLKMLAGALEPDGGEVDRKRTRLNSSHVKRLYAVCCF